MALRLSLFVPLVRNFQLLVINGVDVPGDCVIQMRVDREFESVIKRSLVRVPESEIDEGSFRDVIDEDFRIDAPFTKFAFRSPMRAANDSEVVKVVGYIESNEEGFCLRVEPEKA